MKNKPAAYLLETFIAPVMLVVSGAILLFNPDSATALISTILAWALIGIGIVVTIALVLRKDYTNIWSWVQIAGCFALGVYFFSNPLVLAKVAGRILGLILVVEGIRNVKYATSDFGRILSVITAVTGAILIFLPLSLSRIIMRILGIVLLSVGVANIFDRVIHRKSDSGRDNIIDADE